MNYPCVATAQITQRFGENPADYKRFGLPGHNGLDLALPIASPVFAAASGKITKIATDPQGYGLYAVIEHNTPYIWLSTWYGHLSYTASKAGQQVNAGQIIGYSGSSGNSTGPHLHFEIRDKNKSFNGYHGAVDPWPYLSELESDPGSLSDFAEIGVAQHSVGERTGEGSAFLALVLEELNIRSRPSTSDGVITGRLPAGIVILVSSIIPPLSIFGENGERTGEGQTWAKVGPMFCAFLYNGSTYLEKISSAEVMTEAAK